MRVILVRTSWLRQIYLPVKMSAHAILSKRRRINLLIAKTNAERSHSTWFERKMQAILADASKNQPTLENIYATVRKLQQDVEHLKDVIEVQRTLLGDIADAMSETGEYWSDGGDPDMVESDDEVSLDLHPAKKQRDHFE